MADGKIYINVATGEIQMAHNKNEALRYFNSDGSNYTIEQVMTLDKYASLIKKASDGRK